MANTCRWRIGMLSDDYLLFMGVESAFFGDFWTDKKGGAISGVDGMLENYYNVGLIACHDFT